MSKKMYWALGVLILLLIGIGAFFIKSEMDLANRKKEDEKRLAKDQAFFEKHQQEVPEHSEGHDHADGTFHDGAHEDPTPRVDMPTELPVEPKEQYAAPEGAVLKPDFPETDPKEDPVKAAYKRLEYIKNNPYAWGGVHSERATELIDQLMTEAGPIRLIDHNHGEEVSVMIDELCRQGDPRAAEVLIAHMSDGDIGGKVITDALVAIGPPAVPYILPYLERENTGETDTISILAVFDPLALIGVRYRSDLGGILDHIIIPKFKEVAADEDSERYRRSSVVEAREALEKLQ